MGQAFDLAEGTILFKGDMTQFDKDIEKGREKLNTLNESMKNNRLVMAAGEAKRLNNELGEAARNARRLMNEVQYGRLGARWREAAPALRDFGRGALRAGTAGVALGGAAIGAAGSASPLAADTLDKSFKLFSATVGQTFIPLIMDLSYTLQDAARWWKGLDQTVKANIANVTKFVAVTGAATLAIAGISTVLSFIARNPLVAALGFVGGIGVSALGNNQSEKVKSGQNEIFDTTKQDAMTSDIGKRLGLMAMQNPEEAKKLAQKNFHEKWREYDLARNTHADIVNNPFMGAMSNITESLTGDSREATARRETIKKGKELEQAKFLMRDFGGANLPDRPGGAEEARKRGMLGSAGPASFVQAGDLLRSIMLKAGSTSELDAQIEVLKKSNDLLAQIEKNTGSKSPVAK